MINNMKKRYIKDNKIVTPPITTVLGGTVIVTTSDRLIKQAGYSQYIEPVYRPTVQQLIEQSNNRINRETDQKILNDFVWNGHQFYLTAQNQRNFSVLYNLIDVKQFPVTIKTKNGFIELQRQQVSGFYLSGVQFIENCLKEGWAKKAAAEQQIRSNY